MSDLTILIKAIYESMIYPEIYFALVIGFILTLLIVKYLKVFIYKYLPTNYKVYYFLSCVHCTGFWITAISLVGAYSTFGFIFEINLFLYIVSIISVAYAVFTSPLFKNIKFNSSFFKNFDVFLKVFIIGIYILISGLLIGLNYKFIFNFLIVPLAFSVIYVLILSIFKVLLNRK